MIASIHQPAYIPWLGYFDKMAKSDVHIFLDDAKYSKNNLFNRNKIKTPRGEAWLTIPVKYKSDLSIYQTEIDNSTGWASSHSKTLKMNYSRAQFFDYFQALLPRFYSNCFKECKYLSDFTIEMNKAISWWLDIETKFVKSSDLKVKGVKNEKLINLCKAVGADTYLSGQGAKAYMDEELFLANNIKVHYQEFHHPVYKQLWGNFIPNLSIIDFLFNCGAEKFKEINKKTYG